MTPTPSHPMPQRWAGIRHAPPTSAGSAGHWLPSAGFGADANDLGMVGLREAYRHSGGIARGDDLGRLLEDYRCGDFVSLARWIVGGRVFGFEWHHTLWLPMFQFESHGLAPKPGLTRVLAELPQQFKGWGLAAWFANANPRLEGRRPAELIDQALFQVLAAARHHDDGTDA